MTPVPARTISVSIDRPAADVYAYAADPRNLPEWAPGFARAVSRGSTGWTVQTDDGPVEVAFAPPNDLGVLDHRVTDGQGREVLNPMRVLPNGNGAEVLFTVFRAPGASEDEFRRDLDLVRHDLARLKSVLEHARE